jgi:predicted PurR-regulated permease PerM
MTAQQAFRNTVVVLLTIALAYVLLISVRILVVLLVAIILASAIRPVVVRLTKWRIPEGLAILLVYLSIAAAIFLLTVVVIPPIVNQFANYMQNEDWLANRIIYAQTWVADAIRQRTGTEIGVVAPDDIRNAVTSFVQGIRTGMPNILGDIGSTAGDAILVFVMGVYWLTSHNSAFDFVTQLFPLSSREKVKEVMVEIENSMGSYMRGVVLVASFVGVANFIILTLLRVPNAATLAFIVGVTTMLPVVGGFIGGGLATAIALIASSPLYGVLTFITFVGVQQIETHYLTPRVMSRSIGVDPLLVIVTIFIGFTLYGVVGAIISIPILGTLAILLRSAIIEPRKASVSGYTIENGLVVLNEPPPEEEPEKPVETIEIAKE